MIGRIICGLTLIAAASGAVSAKSSPAAIPKACPADGSYDAKTDFGWTCRYRADNAALLKSGSAVDVVFMGDSITEGWLRGDPVLFSKGRVDRGISGQTTPQMLIRFRQDVIALHPHTVHIMAGTNDIAGNTGPMTVDDSFHNIRAMAEMAYSNGIKVVIASVLPANGFPWRTEKRPATAIAELNMQLRDYAKARGFAFADYYSAMAGSDGGLSPALAVDGVHPTTQGYAMMRPIAEEAIKSVPNKAR